MLPLAAIKPMLSNIPLLTIAKIGVIIALMGATSYITWQVAQNDRISNLSRLIVHLVKIQGKDLPPEVVLSIIAPMQEVN